MEPIVWEVTEQSDDGAVRTVALSVERLTPTPYGPRCIVSLFSRLTAEDVSELPLCCNRKECVVGGLLPRMPSATNK
ncbi:hypothetical protein AGDE_14729 [Angomonas deanei]|nr:hypothetical protein AGDE_14729 [Angomonas deanei]|eukprot:EPY20344.1 hypothetical protein AGDE_14729 [Angomonas deanei]